MRVMHAVAVPLSLALLLQASPAAADQRFAFGQTWGFEIGAGGGWTPASTPYTRTLETFGFERDRFSRFRFAAAVEKIVLPYFSLLLQTNLLDHQEWSRDSGIGVDDRFIWTAWALDAHVRFFTPVLENFRAYAQLGVGPTFTGTRLYVRTRPSSNAQDRHREVEFGFNVAGHLGFEVLLADHVGFYLQGGYFYSPTPRNELGENHQSGGGLLLWGLSGHFGRQ